jgi:hypothetical protein
LFSESAASQFLEPVIAPRSYDVLLFVEKTTAARKNTDIPIGSATVRYHSHGY